MFSLIITIISIALVAALALATLYYGGNAFNRGSAEARATQLLNQGQQLLGAADLYRADKGSYPASLDVLVADGYLRTIPSMQAANTQNGSLMATATAAVAPAESGTWTMPTPGKAVFALNVGSEADSCRAVNQKSYGKDGILGKAYSSYLAQCYSTSGSYKVIVSRDGNEAVLSVGETEGTTATPPTSDDDSAWVVKPKSSLAGLGAAPGNANTNPTPVAPPVATAPYFLDTLGINRPTTVVPSPELPVPTETIILTLKQPPAAASVQIEDMLVYAPSLGVTFTLTNNTCQGSLAWTSGTATCSMQVPLVHGFNVYPGQTKTREAREVYIAYRVNGVYFEQVYEIAPIEVTYAPHN